MSEKKLRKELAQKHKQLAELQEETANLEDLLPEKDTKYPVQRGYSVIYGGTFKEIIEQLSKGEIKVLWCVKEKFDKHTYGTLAKNNNVTLKLKNLPVVKLARNCKRKSSQKFSIKNCHTNF